MAASQIRIFTLVTILVIWEAVARSGLLYQDVVPSLLKIVSAFVRMLFEPQTWKHFAVSAWEIGAGLTIGYILGVLFGLVAGTRRFFGKAVAPYVDGIATAPKIVFLPIVMLLVGTGIGSKLALGALSAFFPVAINMAASVRQVPNIFVRVGHSFRLTRWQMATRVYLPALRPSLITSLRLGFGLAVVGVLLAEIKLSNAGLGFLANEHYSHYRVADLYAVLALVFLVAVVLNNLMGRFADRR
jgi:NitT/TauT family transport system permease protein